MMTTKYGPQYIAKNQGVNSYFPIFCTIIKIIGRRYGCGKSSSSIRLTSGTRMLDLDAAA